MASLHLVSPAAGDGKTAIAVALLKTLSGRGLERYVRIGEPTPHPDATFVKQALGTVATAGEMTLAPGDAEGLRKATADGAVLIEGDGSPPNGARALVVASYRGDKTAETARKAGSGNAVGVILNAVPAPQQRFVEREVRPALERVGLKVLGVLPELRELRSATVAELAEFLGGEVLCAFDALDNVVETYMIGAMSHQGGSSLPYFNRMQNKAVVTGGDRIDVHMGALGTPTQCIVATGGFDPDPVVIERAEAENVPIVKVQEETPETMERIGDFMRAVRFRQPYKVDIMVGLVRQHVDVASIEGTLGLRSAAGVS